VIDTTDRAGTETETEPFAATVTGSLGKNHVLSSRRVSHVSSCIPGLRKARMIASTGYSWNCMLVLPVFTMTVVKF